MEVVSKFYSLLTESINSKILYLLVEDAAARESTFLKLSSWLEQEIAVVQVL